MKLTTAMLTILGFGLFFLSAFLLFEPNNSPTGFFAYTPSLAIVNTDNNVPINSNLEIEFITKGTNDLTITPLGNMEFLELKCNNQIMSTSMEHKDYNCNGDSSLTVKVLSRKLEIELKFGDAIQQTINIAP